MNDSTKLTIGLLLLLSALALITSGCGVTWGVSGALMGAGIVSAIYGFVALSKIS